MVIAVRMNKKVGTYYLFIIGLFAILFIVFSGNKKVDIVTSNVHNVKSILSTRIVKPETIPTTKLVTNTNDIKAFGKNYKISLIVPLFSSFRKICFLL